MKRKDMIIAKLEQAIASAEVHLKDRFCETEESKVVITRTAQTHRQQAGRLQSHIHELQEEADHFKRNLLVRVQSDREGLTKKINEM
jgi:predicted phage-related endonuclease